MDYEKVNRRQARKTAAVLRYFTEAGSSYAPAHKFLRAYKSVGGIIEFFRAMCYNGNMVKFNETMSEQRARGMNAVVLAFIGDAVYSLYVRESLVFAADYKTGMLQKLTSAQVSAKGQAKLLEEIYEKLTETEREIFLRGRNAKKPTKSKNASVAEYNLSTGFEAVIGYLYLIGDYARIDELVGRERYEN